MKTPFVSAVIAPTEKPASTLFFAFQDDRLLVYQDGDTAHLPQRDDFAALGLPIRAQHYLGTAGATHCYAVELGETNTPKGMALKSLRNLFELIDESTIDGRIKMYKNKKIFFMIYPMLCMII